MNNLIEQKIEELEKQLLRDRLGQYYDILTQQGSIDLIEQFLEENKYLIAKGVMEEYIYETKDRNDGMGTNIKLSIKGLEEYIGDCDKEIRN